MKKNLTFAITCAVVLFVASCKKTVLTTTDPVSQSPGKIHALGAILDSAAFKKIPRANFESVRKRVYQLLGKSSNVSTFALTDNLPSSIILPHPDIGDQGSTGTCVSWSVGYALLGTLNNSFPQPGVSNPRSPWFIFQVDHSQKNNCSTDYGMDVSYGMTILGANGVPAYSAVPSLGSPCASPSSTAYNDAYTDRSYTFSSLYSISDIRNAISLGLPVEMGFNVYTSFDDAFNNGTIYSSAYGTNRGSHAVCIIGYDDNKNAFLVQNSWGVYGGDSANPGCVWIDYGLVSNSSLGIQLYLALPSAPLEGQFVRNDNTGQVYIVIDGYLRYIPNQQVLYGLFTFNQNMLHHLTSSQLSGTPVGAAINTDNGLVNDNYTGRVYFREVNYLRYIPSLTIRDFYHFNWNAIQNSSGIYGYTVGPDM